MFFFFQVFITIKKNWHFFLFQFFIFLYIKVVRILKYPTYSLKDVQVSSACGYSCGNDRACGGGGGGGVNGRSSETQSVA